MSHICDNKVIIYFIPWSIKLKNIFFGRAGGQQNKKIVWQKHWVGWELKISVQTIEEGG